MASMHHPAYTPQPLAASPPGYYYYPQMQQAQYPSVMQNPVYSSTSASSSFFFDVLDPHLDSYPISQHMASSSRTFIGDN